MKTQHNQKKKKKIKSQKELQPPPTFRIQPYPLLGTRAGRKGEHAAAAAKSLQSCPTLCNPTDGSPPGSPVPGILQARTPEWVAISFSNA